MYPADNTGPLVTIDKLSSRSGPFSRCQSVSVGSILRVYHELCIIYTLYNCPRKVVKSSYVPQSSAPPGKGVREIKYAWPHCVNPGPCPVFNSPMAISSPSITAPHSTVCTFCSNASRSSSSPLTKGISRTRIGFPMSTSEITLWIITPVLSILPSSQAACARSMAFYYGVRMNQQIFVNKTKKREREGGVKKKKKEKIQHTTPLNAPGKAG